MLAGSFQHAPRRLTQWNSPASAALEKQYGFGSLPTIVILKSDGTEIKSLRVTGRLSVSDFQKRLQAASAGKETHPGE